MQKKIVLAGGTGFIGDYFKKQFSKQGYDVKIISRKAPAITWNDQQGIIDALEGAEMVINLAGKSVNCRYHDKNKKDIITSRTGTTKLLGDALNHCQNPPELWINASTATIYRHAEDRPMTEENGEIGTGFSVDVAKKWERAFFNFSLPNTRQIALRIAIVLGPDGGVITPYKNLVNYGLGGIQGDGKQMFSWIHVEDLFQITQFLQSNTQLSGIFNCSSPNPIPNHHLMRALRQQLNRPVGLPAPHTIIRIRCCLPKNRDRAYFEE
ncbi:cell division inhibitor [Gracilibacillus boraciitolerans JCM 21714]|uniref:Cell division inhibitor n=1 Tax=Gracilibacillus boraciitolerans JCM 21714 TaxID=1298598 RepID=W4VJ82_9BACI|nr:cell division inhibitor [Gracilibacillus boraciitolerans JCM 21714]